MVNTQKWIKIVSAFLAIIFLLGIIGILVMSTSKVGQVKPANPGNLTVLSTADQGNAAIKNAKDLLEKNKNDPNGILGMGQGYSMLANSFMKDGSIDNARDAVKNSNLYYDKLLALEPKLATSIFLVKADNFSIIKDVNSAEAIYQKLLSEDKDNYSVYGSYGQYLFEVKGDKAKGLEYLNQALAKTKNSTDKKKVQDIIDTYKKIK